MLSLPPFFLGLLLLAAPAPVTGPTLAVEDTLHTRVSEVLVRAPRVTLDEVLDRVARGEARRESLLADESFTATVRVVRDVAGTREPRAVSEATWRVFRKRPDRVRTVLLRRWEVKPRKPGNEPFQVDFSPGMGEDVARFAFLPEARREYRYRIVARDLVGGHLVYQIAFEPRSPLAAAAPSGRVWVETNDFVIVRQEVSFRHSPVPLLIASLPRMVVERRRVGSFWVLSRVLMRARFTLPLPRVGRSVDLSIHYDDYRLNEGLPDSVFTGGGSR